MSTEDTFETDNTVLSTETTTKQPSSDLPEGNTTTNESIIKPDTTSEASDDATNVNSVVQEVDEELLKVDQKRKANIRYHKNQQRRQREQEVASELAEIKQQLKTLTEKQQAPTSQSAYNQTTAQNPNLIWDANLQQYVDPNELIAYGNNLLAQSGKQGNMPNAQVAPHPAQPQAAPARPEQQQQMPQNPTLPPDQQFSTQVQAQAQTLSKRERTAHDIPPNELSNFEATMVNMFDDGLLNAAIVNGAALASKHGLETLYEWSQTDLGRDKLKEIKTYYQNPYEQATEIGRLVKMRDEQRAARSKSHVPQQAQPLTESTSDLQDYFNRDMTTIINDRLRR